MAMAIPHDEIYVNGVHVVGDIMPAEEYDLFDLRQPFRHLNDSCLNAAMHEQEFVFVSARPRNVYRVKASDVTGYRRSDGFFNIDIKMPGVRF